MGKSIYAHGKKKVEEEQQRERWDEHFIICQDTGLMSCYYFIIMVKKTEDPLQCGGLVVLHPASPPLHYSSIQQAVVFHSTWLTVLRCCSEDEVCDHRAGSS